MADNNLTPGQERLLEEVAERAAEKAVAEMFLKLGVRVDTPEGIIEVQRDLMHLRDWRLAVNAVEKRGAWMIVSALITGLIAAAGLGIVAMINGQHPGAGG